MESTLLYTVEVQLIGGSLPGMLSDMRTWLDHHRIEPDSFRHFSRTGKVVFRVEFKLEPEAWAFAKAFGGRVLPVPLAAEPPLTGPRAA
jgi:hypothetical protein